MISICTHIFCVLDYFVLKICGRIQTGLMQCKFFNIRIKNEIIVQVDRQWSVMFAVLYTSLTWTFWTKQINKTIFRSVYETDLLRSEATFLGSYMFIVLIFAGFRGSCLNTKTQTECRNIFQCTREITCSETNMFTFLYIWLPPKVFSDWLNVALSWCLPV